MVQPLREMMQSFRASPVFVLAVLLALALTAIVGGMTFIMMLQPGFLDMAHFSDPTHRTHELTYGFLFATAGVGLLAQLRRPSKNAAGMVMALIPWAALLLAAVLSANAFVILSTERIAVAVVAVIAALVYPGWHGFFRSFSVARINRVMLALVAIAAVPLLVYAFTNIRLQATVTDSHAVQAHYGFMAAFSFTIIGIGLLASLRPDGWWLPAWVAGLLPVLLGLTSLVYPDATSSLGLLWALAAIAWGVGFVAAAELTQDAERPTLLGSRGIIPTLGGSRDALSMGNTCARPAEDRPVRTPVWMNVVGIIVLVPLVLAVGQNWAMIAGAQGPGGGFPGARGPGGGGLGPGADMHGPGGDHEGNTPPIAGAPELAITANALAFSPARIELGPGQPQVNIALTSADVLHDLVVDEIGFHLAADRGETVIGGLTVRSFGVPGTYIGYCSVPGHREAGMEIEIVVTTGRQH
jgi:plastocyanin